MCCCLCCCVAGEIRAVYGEDGVRGIFLPVVFLICLLLMLLCRRSNTSSLWRRWRPRYFPPCCFSYMLVANAVVSQKPLPAPPGLSMPLPPVVLTSLLLGMCLTLSCIRISATARNGASCSGRTKA
jgi:hypothetical protein